MILMKFACLACLVLASVALAAPVASGPFKPALSVWPQPASWQTTAGSIAVQPGITIDGFFTVSTGTALTKTLAAVFDRYAPLCFPHSQGPPTTQQAPGVAALQVTVASESEDYPQFGLDESYNLTVTGSTATLEVCSPSHPTSSHLFAVVGR